MAWERHAMCESALRLQTHTRVCTTRCCSVAIMVTRTPLSVTLYVQCLSCSTNMIGIMLLVTAEAHVCLPAQWFDFNQNWSVERESKDCRVFY